MSSRDWVFRIRDILVAIDKIERYVEDMNMTQFKLEELVIDAVIRNFEIIGEASKNVPSSVRRSYPSIPWSQMSGMRDVLIHEYFGVDLKTLWHIFTTPSKAAINPSRRAEYVRTQIDFYRLTNVSMRLSAGRRKGAEELATPQTSSSSSGS